LRIVVLQGGGSVSAIFSCTGGRPPPIIFLHGLIGDKVVTHSLECVTTLSLTVFTQINFVADFLKAKSFENGHFAFLAPRPFWGVGATYGAHLRVIEKRVVDFLILISVN